MQLLRYNPQLYKGGKLTEKGIIPYVALQAATICRKNNITG